MVEYGVKGSDVPGSQGPVGESGHVVKQGESLPSLVESLGLNWETVWNLSENAALREARNGDASALLPGDRVYIPPLRKRSESVPTEERHRFTKRATPNVFRLALERYDGPRAGESYVIYLGHESREGRLDDQGRLEEPLPSDVSQVVIYLGKKPTQEKLVIQLGGLDPMNEVSGIQQRLSYLAYDPGKIDGLMGPTTRGALILFQEDHCDDDYMLKVDGIPGPKTQEALEMSYRSHSE